MVGCHGAFAAAWNWQTMAEISGTWHLDLSCSTSKVQPLQPPLYIFRWELCTWDPPSWGQVEWADPPGSFCCGHGQHGQHGQKIKPHVKRTSKPPNPAEIMLICFFWSFWGVHGSTVVWSAFDLHNNIARQHNRDHLLVYSHIRQHVGVVDPLPLGDWNCVGNLNSIQWNETDSSF